MGGGRGGEWGCEGRRKVAYKRWDVMWGCNVGGGE